MVEQSVEEDEKVDEESIFPSGNRQAPFSPEVFGLPTLGTGGYVNNFMFMTFNPTDHLRNDFLCESSYLTSPTVELLTPESVDYLWVRCQSVREHGKM